jgi:transcription antitermination factor NusG
MSGAETKALAGLEAMHGVRGYAPMRTICQRVKRKEALKIGCWRKQVKRVVFQGYVFVRFDPIVTAMSDVLGASKALSFVSSGGVAARVDQRFIEAMMSSEISGEWDEGRAAAKKLLASIGSPVLINSGALAGFIGVLREVSLGGMVETATVDVEIMGATASVVLDVESELRL